jgi:hypothetical protein
VHTPGPDPSGPEAIRRDMANVLAAVVYSGLPDLRLDYANRYSLEYFGLALEDVADHHWIGLVHPDDPTAKLHPCGVWYRIEPI